MQAAELTVGDLVKEQGERLRDWPVSGVPAEPRAWLTVAARRKAIDILRREARRSGKEREGVELMDLGAPDPPDAVVRDDQLRLLFTCCHPSLALEARVALALRTLCGLSAEEAGIPYRVPSAAELPARLAAVCAVVHSLYTSGHTRLSGDRLLDVYICAEAIRYCRTAGRWPWPRRAARGLLGATSPGQMTYDLRRLRLNGLIERIEHTNRYILTGDGIRATIFYTKIYNRMLRPLMAADQPQAPPELREALKLIGRHVDDYATQARLGKAVRT